MTTDERLAALEAKMDALTAPPSDYYTSRYSGEEIDAAIAAVPGKAETAQLCNRNLLDNWYFGNSVNQRGQTSYTANGYTVDRWSLYTDGGNVAIANEYLDIYSAKQYGHYLTQVIAPELAKALAGKTVTYSVLAADSDAVFSAIINKDGVYIDGFTIAPNTVSCKTWTFPSSTDVSFGFGANAAGHVRPIAVKLELGSQQTLAHQDADGNWVLNEVPDYGEQLRRCQRYFVRLSGDSYWSVVGIARCYGTNNATLVFWLPVPMRTLPTIVASGLTVNGVAVSSITIDQYNPTCLKCKGTLATNVSAGIYIIEQYGSGYVDASADL